MMPKACHECKQTISRNNEQTLVCDTCGAIFHRFCVSCPSSEFLDRLKVCSACASVNRKVLPSVDCPTAQTPPTTTPTSLKRKERDTPTPPLASLPTTKNAPPTAVPITPDFLTSSRSSTENQHFSFNNMQKNDEMPTWFEKWQNTCFQPSLMSMSVQFDSLNTGIRTVDEKVSNMQSSVAEAIEIVRSLREDLTELKAEVFSLRDTVSSNSDKICNIESAGRRVENAVYVLDDRVSNLEKDICGTLSTDAGVSLAAQYDTCEALISGFPLQPTIADMRDEVNALFAAMKLPELHKSV